MKTTRIKMTPREKKSAKNQKQPPEKIIETIRKKYNLSSILYCFSVFRCSVSVSQRLRYLSGSTMCLKDQSIRYGTIVNSIL